MKSVLNTNAISCTILCQQLYVAACSSPGHLHCCLICYLLRLHRCQCQQRHMIMQQIEDRIDQLASVAETSWRMPIIVKRAMTLLHSTFLVHSTAFRTTYYLTNLQHMALLAPLSNGCKAFSLVTCKLCV